MSTASALLTVEQFESIPDPSGGYYELHHGELMFEPWPRKAHTDAQRILMLLLNAQCGKQYFVDKEFACRPLPEHEFLVADVAMVERSRWAATGKNEWLSGSPGFVAEVLSPSNTAQKMIHRENTFFKGGCREFWVVDPAAYIVRTSTPEGHGRTWRSGDSIPLAAFGGGSIVVSDIFDV
jgi:Uma2 family endonuclease